MVPLQGPILKSILLLIFVILISVKAQTRKAPFDGIMRMKNTKNVTGSFLTAQEKNSHVHMFMVSRVPIHYEIVKCNKTLLSTRVNMTFQEVTFTNAWVNWIFNDNCSETDHLKFNVFANKYFNVTFGIEFLSGESAKLLDPDRIHFVHHVANESSIFNTSVAPLFFEANATEGKNLHLISDLTSRATVSFGKCGYELSKYYHLEEDGDIFLGEEDIESILYLSHIKCPKNDTIYSFEIYLASEKNVTGTFTFLLRNDNDNSTGLLAKILFGSGAVITVIGLVIFALWVKKSMSWTYYSIPQQNSMKIDYLMSEIEDESGCEDNLVFE